MTVPCQPSPYPAPVPYDPHRHHRRSIRLKTHDYAAPGAYFVTVCVKDLENTSLSVVASEGVALTPLGEIVESVWRDLPNHYGHVELDAFVVMPDHVHGIVVLRGSARDPVGAGLRPAPTTPPIERTGMEPPQAPRHGLPEIVRAFKSFSARRINEAQSTPGVGVWQRDYFETIIHNERHLEHTRAYILGNPGCLFEQRGSS